MQEGAPLAAVPVPAGERIVTLDFVRGAAVLGILVANLVAFSHPLIAYDWPIGLPRWEEPGNRGLWLAQFLLVDGKMRGLFTLLFGAGVALFLDRAPTTGRGYLVQVRRLVWLGLIGLAHFFLLFWGDILFLYAIAGLMALPFMTMTAPQLMRVGVTWYIVAALFLALAYAGVLTAHLTGDEVGRQALAAAFDERRAIAELEIETYYLGDYMAELAFVAQYRTDLLVQAGWFAVFETVPLMLIGAALLRMGLFSGRYSRSGLMRWGGAGFLIGLALHLPLALWVMGEGHPYWLGQFAADAASQLPRLPMVLGLVALLVTLAPDAARSWLGERIALAGRMALSNYVGMSLLMMLLFRHWAGGQWGDLDRVGLLLPMLLGWLVMLDGSKRWLARFRYGPLEWLWRCATYWRIFPLRK